MEEQRTAILKWVKEVFAVVGIKDPPDHLMQYYTDQILANTLSYEQVKQEAIKLGSKRTEIEKTENTPQLQELNQEKQSENERKAKIAEYVDQLYITYTGRKGDPASTNFLIKNITDKIYTLTQAEYFVKFSKEAKAYQKQKKAKEEETKVAQAREFVKELFRVYLKRTPTEDEISSYADSLLDGSTTAGSLEDEFRLMSISVPGQH